MIAVVESLPAHLEAMALYCYGPLTREERDEYLEEIQVALYRKLLADGIKLPGARQAQSEAAESFLLSIPGGGVSLRGDDLPLLAIGAANTQGGARIHAGRVRCGDRC